MSSLSKNPNRDEPVALKSAVTCGLANYTNLFIYLSLCTEDKSSYVEMCVRLLSVKACGFRPMVNTIEAVPCALRTHQHMLDKVARIYEDAQKRPKKCVKHDCKSRPSQHLLIKRQYRLTNAHSSILEVYSRASWAIFFFS